MKALVLGLLDRFGVHVKEEIKEIQVWDEAVNKIQVVTEEEKLNAINVLWANREEVILQHDPVFSHKVDVVLHDGKSTRWLYAPEGYIVILTKTKTPIYQFTQPHKLKSLLITE